MLEELLKYLGLDPTTIKTTDDFKKVFDPEFVRKSAAKEDKDIIAAITGKRIGALATKVREIAKKNAVDLTKGDIEKKDVEEVIQFVFEEMGKTNLETVTTLKADLAKSGDEKVIALQKELDKTKSDYTQLNDLHTKTTSDFNTFKDGSTKQMKEFKLTRLKDEEMGKVKFRQDVKPVEKEGFNSIMAKNYSIDLSEDEKQIIPLGSDGKKIASTKVTGAFKTYAEVLEEEAQKLGLLSQVPGTAKVIPGAVVTTPVLDQQVNDKLPINSRAVVQP